MWNRTRARFLLLEICLVLPLVADQKPPIFVFGGKQFYVGMPRREAVRSLSACCKLSPPAEGEVEKETVPIPEGMMLGHMILPKEEPTERILGAIYFSGSKVVRITRPMAENVDTYNDDVVGFARAIKRTLATETSDSGTSVLVLSMRHERIGNAESDVVFFVFPNGHGIELHLGTLDKPIVENKRDFVTLDETLSPPK
jgi:hypothetical protein